MSKPGHHVWDGDWCTRCGINASKAKSLKWGCSKAEARRRSGRSSRKTKKPLPE